MSYNVFDAIKDTIFHSNDCFATEEEAKRRAKICDGCSHLTKMNTCNLCGCFMPAKVKYKQATCPKSKW